MDPTTQALGLFILARLDIWAAENGKDGGGIHPVEYNAITGKLVEFLATIDLCKNFNQGIENANTEAYAKWVTLEGIKLVRGILQEKLAA